MNESTKNIKTRFTSDQFQSIDEAIDKLSETILNINERNYNFLSIIFHDLRNPLTYIKMSLDVLLTGSFGEIPPEQKELLQKATSQVDRLNKMIDDVLLNAKFENDKLPINLTSLDVVNLVDDTIQLNQPLAEQKNILLNKKVTENLPHVEIDYKHFSVALNYLINYCVKSTKEGEVNISCYTDEEKKRSIIELKDTSECIGKENIPAIFEPFKCFGLMAKNKEERTGLELSIAKLIVERHNGEITFDTNETNGNHFTITLPL